MIMCVPGVPESPIVPGSPFIPGSPFSPWLIQIIDSIDYLTII